SSFGWIGARGLQPRARPLRSRVRCAGAVPGPTCASHPWRSMKAIIPLAGKGTRLRPHTHITPKPLLQVGGRPVMSYILDDLIELGVQEVVLVVGHLGDVIREHIAREYPKIKAHYVVQEVQDGTAGAIKLAEPWADE